MAVKASDPIIGPARGSAEEFIAWGEEVGVDRLPEFRDYARELWDMHPETGIDPVIPAGAFSEETARGNTMRKPGGAEWPGGRAWRLRLNPASIGITSTGKPGEADNDRGMSWPNGVSAARAQLAHLYAYATGREPGWAFDNERVAMVLADPNLGGRAPRLQDLGGRYAANTAYGGNVAARANEIFADAPDAGAGGGGMATKPKVLIVRGHGTVGDGGAWSGGISEETHNRRIAPAIAAALEAAGYAVDRFPAPLASEAPGTLDTAGAAARAWCAALRGAPGVMLDIHLESSAAEGMFAIVPDDRGLVTGAPGRQPAEDVWENNLGERRLGLAICEEVSRRTGIPIRAGWLKARGLMSEMQTFVGGGGGGQYPPSRLAMYGYTAEFQPNVYRLVVEFGALQNDAEFFGASTFPAAAAAGVVAAFAREFGGASGGGGTVTTTTTAAPAKGLTYPAGMDKDIASSLFGKVVTEDLSAGPPQRKVWQFTEAGSVSRLWLAEGKRTGVWPKLVARDLYDEREYFTFANGLVIWRPNAKAKFAVLK